jgi:5-formyltetrahydrofolate cyclo-ligase
MHPRPCGGAIRVRMDALHPGTTRDYRRPDLPAAPRMGYINKYMSRKEELRDSIRERLRALPAEDIAWKSYQLCNSILALPAWHEALFASLPTEPVVEFLWDHIRSEGKRACYPKVNGDNLNLILVNDPTELVASRWQLREPVMREPNLQSPEKVDLILVPGLAFSWEGARLGRGGGFYDRLLARDNIRAFKLGVCFDVQLQRELPLENHDVMMDAIATESGIFRRSLPSSSHTAAS